MVNFKASTFAVLNKGKFIDNYDLGDILGEGGFGQVLKCVHKLSQQERAVKLISKEQCTDEMRMDFLKETDVLKRLSHPNIIRIYEIYEDEVQFYLVTELCTGGDLFDEISRRGKNSFSEKSAAQIMKEILFAINHCHSENICHRDLKPENILLDTNNRIKLIDFGTAEAFDHSSGMKGVIGTPYYIAPEVLQENKAYSEKCDIWSLGVMLFVLLTGQAPFNARTDEEIFKKIQAAIYPKNVLDQMKISKSCQDLISKMLTKDPKKRITASEAYQHPWFQQQTDAQEQSFGDEMDILNNLQNFQQSEKMKRIVVSYITSQLVSRDEMEQAEKTFRQLDTNGNGKLDRNELIKGFRNAYGEFTEREVDKIMKAADLDGSGEIDISEWKAAATGLKLVLTKERLHSAFAFFDKDGSGTISVTELKEALNAKEGLIDESFWENLIKEVDGDGNGEIDESEFESMMMKLVETIPNKKL